MNTIVKVLTGILAVVAVIACLATVGILGYSMVHPGDDGEEETVRSDEEAGKDNGVLDVSAQLPQQPVPTAIPDNQSESGAQPTPLTTAAPENRVVNLANHVHDYEESVETKATCYRAGRLKYTCEECGDTYYVDVMSTGHVAGDWETSRKATAGQEGIRVKKCIYCDEIVAQESVPYVDANASASASPGSSDEDDEETGPHKHQYAANTEREPSCTLAGLRKYTCECGDFYTEMIPALGHVATDWEVAAEPTTTKMGTEQRTCSVCGVLLDSRPVNKLTAAPAASAGASGNSQSGASAAPASSGGNSQASSAPGSSASPAASAHSHEYQSYILKQANCSQEGIRSFICSCGSSYAESIERDLNSHTYRATIIPATKATQGYTVYTCVRCNYSYVDNYTPALGN